MRNRTWLYWKWRICEFLGLNPVNQDFDSLPARQQAQILAYEKIRREEP